MMFGPVPLAQAEGAILAHSVALEGGGRIRKGRVLDTADIARLAGAGISTVTVARLLGDDLHEDAAATALGQALIGAAAVVLEQQVLGHGGLLVSRAAPGGPLPE